MQRTLGHALPSALQAHVVRYAVAHPRHWGGQWEADHRGEPIPTNRYKVLQGIPDDSAEESDEPHYEAETAKHDHLIDVILDKMQWGPRRRRSPTSVAAAPSHNAAPTSVEGGTTLSALADGTSRAAAVTKEWPPRVCLPIEEWRRLSPPRDTVTHQADDARSSETESNSSVSSSEEDSSCDWSMERIEANLEACTVAQDCPLHLVRTIFADAPLRQSDDSDDNTYHPEPDSIW